MKALQRLILATLLCMAALHTQAAPFFASKDGSMVWDKATGLVWMRCALGLQWNENTCTGKASKLNFDETGGVGRRLNAAGGLGGFTDWTVPTSRQLITLRTCSAGFDGYLDLADGLELVPQKCSDGSFEPPIDPIAFPNIPEKLWTSSSSSRVNHNAWYVTSPRVTHNAWYVSFINGNLSYDSRAQPLPVQLVRSNQLENSEAIVGFPVSLPVTDLVKSAQVRAQKVKDELRAKELLAEQERRKAEAEQAIKERKAEAERAAKERKAEAERQAELRRTLAMGAQGLYLKAARLQRDGYNGDAEALYDLIIEHFPKDPLAVKAADQLTAMGRSESQARASRQAASAAREAADAQRRADGNASSRAACFSRVNKCVSLCQGNIYNSNRDLCGASCHEDCN